MKSIDDTLKIIRDITSAIPVKFDIALVGGVAVILHGVERTTIDVDFCVYSDAIQDAGSSAFFEQLKAHLPKRFSVRLISGKRVAEGVARHAFSELGLPHGLIEHFLRLRLSSRA